ncbi:LytR/AlgR family response regulator transcription factor [Lichenicola sp.]|uniref:LytR/AlgR family response regulator transcription factor n=1 Tax=Lichenicola sp. TaxID=2804529 RepID=UPI003B0081AB
MPADRPLRTLVVDDEPLAVERLQVLCARLDAVELVGAASDGEAALRLIEALSPDLILLDISMPGLDGLAVARALERRPVRPALVFCTAFDQFAVSAFDVAASDYLLKPVELERLAKAVARVSDAAPAVGRTTSSPWVEELWVPHRSEMIRLSVAEIDRIEAERD